MIYEHCRRAKLLRSGSLDDLRAEILKLEKVRDWLATRFAARLYSSADYDSDVVRSEAALLIHKAERSLAPHPNMKLAPRPRGGAGG